MTRNLLSSLIFILLFFVLNFYPAAGTEFYDENGKKINESKYEKIIKKRKSKIDKIQKEGYRGNAISLKDPILLRKKRIEQWKLLRKSKG
ncbi:hypothetical protein ACFL0M_12280 [Thermodesulfobacteriota bacterium]